jgi:hypothetical protein
MTERPSRKDFVVSRLEGVGTQGGKIVLWTIFKAGKHQGFGSFNKERCCAPCEDPGETRRSFVLG